MQTYETLDVAERGDVFRIAFDRPDDLNAINKQLHRELTYVFEDAYRSDARVVLLTGNGPAFSAGGDLGWLQEAVEDPTEYQQILREGEAIIQRLLALEKPIVAKIQGDAIGLGATLALFCDISVASEEATIGDPHVNIGLVAGDGGTVIWPLLVGINKAKELLLTGTQLSATEAADLGLLNHAVPPAELDDRVDEFVTDLATGPQTAIRYTKMSLNRIVQRRAIDLLPESLAFEGISQQHPDHREGVDAFLEGRRPEFPSARGDTDSPE